jgi:hypothetical protein
MSSVQSIMFSLEDMGLIDMYSSNTDTGRYTLTCADELTRLTNAREYRAAETR